MFPVDWQVNPLFNIYFLPNVRAVCVDSVLVGGAIGLSVCLCLLGRFV